MNQDLSSRIASLPAYQRLKSRRTRLGWALTALMLVVYYGFVMLVAFAKPLLAQRLGSGVMTLGIPVGFGVIVFTIALTAFYVRRANAEFDTLSDAIRMEAAK
jgi:uncharacterized membrane protein (DUF485 family)